MHFCSFRHEGRSRAGVLRGDRVHDLAHPALSPALAGTAPDMLALIEAGLARAADRIAHYGLSEEATLDRSTVELLAPLVDPGRIFGIASNYRGALAELGRAPPAEPLLFMKLPSTLIGPGAEIILPGGIGGCTYEAELAVVIGTTADAVPRDQALSHVAAYGVFNDISASEMIRREGAFVRGKNLPTFGPFGPFLATADEIPDPQALALGLSNNGIVLQDSTTADMLFDVATLIATLSRQTPLQPGDIIATGTPAGIAPARTPPSWIKPGDTLIAWVDGLGSLANPVVAGSPLHV